VIYRHVLNRGDRVFRDLANTLGLGLGKNRHSIIDAEREQLGLALVEAEREIEYLVIENRGDTDPPHGVKLNAIGP
jgi:hypothetical protein